MATLYGRGKGKAGSHPPELKKSLWQKKSADEVKKLIIELAKDNEPAKIGIILRDNYGINSVKALTKESIGEIVRAAKMEKEMPYDLANLVKKAIKLEKHNKGNKQDKTAKRGLQLTKAKIIRLAKYYKRKKRILADWKY